MHRTTLIVASLCACVLTACGAATPDQKLQIDAPIKGQISDPVHGKETGLSIGAMSGVGKTVANGVATVHQMEDGTAIVGVQLNIAVAKEGSHYSAWLTTAMDAPRISLGTLMSSAQEVRHSVKNELPKLDSANNLVLVTLEGPGISEGSQIVASGKLKAISR